MGLTASRFDSTTEFKPADWDGFHSGEFYFRYSFLRAVELTKVNDARFRFLTYSHHGKAIGAVVLSSFLLQLDLLAGEPAILKGLKKLYPHLLKIPVVCCGIPVSYGQHHFCTLDPAYTNSILDAVHQEMNLFAKETNSKLLAWKEFNDDFESEKALTELGYLRLQSIPDTVFLSHEDSITGFVNSLRSPYRRKMKKTVAALANKDSNNKGLSVRTESFQKEHVEAFYAGYMAVMNRTPVKLEVYPASFFQHLIEEYDDRIELLTIRNEQDQELSALLIPDAHALNFILVSKNNSRYEDALYAELLRAIILYGIEKGHKKIKMGQTSYYSKMAAGASPVPLHIYLRSYRKSIHFLLDKCGSLLFPDTPLPRLNPYKPHEPIAQG